MMKRERKKGVESGGGKTTPWPVLNETFFKHTYISLLCIPELQECLLIHTHVHCKHFGEQMTPVHVYHQYKTSTFEVE